MARFLLFIFIASISSPTLACYTQYATITPVGYDPQSKSIVIRHKSHYECASCSFGLQQQDEILLRIDAGAQDFEAVVPIYFDHRHYNFDAKESTSKPKPRPPELSSSQCINNKNKLGNGEITDDEIDSIEKCEVLDWEERKFPWRTLFLTTAKVRHRASKHPLTPVDATWKDGKVTTAAASVAFELPCGQDSDAVMGAVGSCSDVRAFRVPETSWLLLLVGPTTASMDDHSENPQRPAFIALFNEKTGAILRSHFVSPTEH